MATSNIHTSTQATPRTNTMCQTVYTKLPKDKAMSRLARNVSKALRCFSYRYR